MSRFTSCVVTISLLVILSGYVWLLMGDPKTRINTDIAITNLTINTTNIAIANLTIGRTLIHGLQTFECENCSAYGMPISVLITSCGRWDLLSQTIESFERYNSYKYIMKKIVVDDCMDDIGFNETKHRFKHLNYLFVRTTTPRTERFAHYKTRAGMTILDGLKHVNTEWVLHLEDDWLFYRPTFIEKSLQIMCDQIACDQRISMVTLRNLQMDKPYISNYDFCGGPALDRMHNHTYRIHDTWLYLFGTSNTDVYHHWSANPGLKNVKQMRSNLEYCLERKARNMEKCVAGLYQKQDYIMAIMHGNGFVGHMGKYTRHVHQEIDINATRRRLRKYNETNCVYLPD
eukprot:81920_1